MAIATNMYKYALGLLPRSYTQTHPAAVVTQHLPGITQTRQTISDVPFLLNNNENKKERHCLKTVHDHSNSFTNTIEQTVIIVFTPYAMAWSQNGFALLISAPT